MIPQIPLHTAGRIGLNVLLLLAGVVALRLGESVVVPLLIAVLLATVLGPAAAWLHRVSKFSWEGSCIAVILGLVAVNLLFVVIFSGSISRMVQQIPSPNDKEKFISRYQEFRGKLAAASPWELDVTLFPPDPKEVSEIQVYRYITDTAPWFFAQLGRSASAWLWQMVLVLFITLFVLLEGNMLARRAVAIFGPSPEVQAKASAVLTDMAQQIRTYLVWRTIINFGLAIVMGIIYQTFGLSQPWTWAILLAILNYIPYLGPILAGIPVFIDAMIYASPVAAVGVLVLYGIVIVFEGYLIVPLLMGRNMDLNATTVMLACLFWELVWGMTGLFLAMPIMAGIKAVLYHVPEWRVWANLMSSNEAPPEAPPVIVPPAVGDSPNGKLGTPHADGDLPADAGDEAHRPDNEPV